MTAPVTRPPVTVTVVPSCWPVPAQVRAELAAAGYVPAPQRSRRPLDPSLLCRVSMQHHPDDPLACRDCGLASSAPIFAITTPYTLPCVTQEA